MTEQSMADITGTGSGAAVEGDSSRSPWRAPTSGSEIHERLAGATILLVDDDEDFRAITADILARLDADVLEAEDGCDALVQAERGRPDIVLLDQRMPGMTGAQVADQLRRRGCTAEIVLVTAARDARDIARRAGLDLWLQKPFSIEQLHDVLERAHIARER